MYAAGARRRRLAEVSPRPREDRERTARGERNNRDGGADDEGDVLHLEG
jgi:hypothetical protein